MKEEIYQDQVEGRNAVLELIESGKDINKIYVEKGEKQGSINKILARAKERKILVTEIDKVKFRQMVQTPNAQGIIAIVPPFDYCDVYDIIDFAKEKNEEPFVVILDGIEDPHNLGSIIRTAETAGAVEHMRIARVNNIVETINTLKKEGIWICGTDMEATEYYYRQDLTGPLAIVIGSEGNGMSRLTKENCDFLTKIPMQGKITSLNASVSAGIVIYESRKQRMEK